MLLFPVQITVSKARLERVATEGVSISITVPISLTRTSVSFGIFLIFLAIKSILDYFQIDRTLKKREICYLNKTSIINRLSFLNVLSSVRS